MDEGRQNNDIWDEHMWEAHMNRMEKKTKQLRKFIESNMDDELPRWLTLLDENNNKFEVVDAFIEEELETEDCWFPEDIDDDENWDDKEDDFWLEEFDEEDFIDEDQIDDYDEGEEWKQLSNDFALSDNGSIENFELYNRAHELSVYILKWADEVDDKYKDKPLTAFVSNTLTIGAKLTGGYSFGFETDFIGGNIACTKKALHAANEALEVLETKIKFKSFINRQEYIHFHKQIFQLRNDIGIYIQELRERFNLGLD